MSFWTAVAALRDSTVFRDVSVRLLADLVELAARDTPPIPVTAKAATFGAVCLVLLDGEVLERRAPALGSDPAQPPGVKGNAGRPTRGAPRAIRPTADGTVYIAPQVIPTTDGAVTLKACGQCGALVLPLTEEILGKAMEASPELAWSLQMDVLRRTNAAMIDSLEQLTPAAEYIWMCEAPGVGAPMEAFAQLLAAGAYRVQAADPLLAQEEDDDEGTRDQRTAIAVTGAGGVRLLVYDPAMVSFHQAGRPWNETRREPLTRAEIEGRLAEWEKEQAGAPRKARRPAKEKPKQKAGAHYDRPRNRYRIFFVRDRDPNLLPPILEEFTFHRIVDVTKTLPEKIPSSLVPRLDRLVQNPSDRSNPYFCSFIPSFILDGPEPHPTRSDIPPLRAILADLLDPLVGGHDGFGDEPVDEDTPLTAAGLTAHPRSRLKRDLCRLRFELGAVQRLWRRSDDGKAFLKLVNAACPPYFDTADRWARAVTNRQVGLAVAGGGATSFRAVPLLRYLAERKVPVDVFSGSSGGALLGAFYCRNGLAGLSRYVSRGLLASVSGVIAGFSAHVIQFMLDWEFRGTRVEDMEVRYVPLTTALPPGGPPEARAVVRGTLGAAIGASGAMPYIFPRVIRRRTVYTDGATATPLPARALPRFGADLVLAFNSITAPNQANPLGDLPFGELLYSMPGIGPFIDLFVTNGFLLAQTSRNAAVDAAIFVEPSPTRSALLEILYWGQAQRLVAESARDERIKLGADACQQRWKWFRR